MICHWVRKNNNASPIQEVVDSWLDLLALTGFLDKILAQIARAYVKTQQMMATSLPTLCARYM
jgi:hypothetical protein